jgi:hypothetical protein
MPSAPSTSPSTPAPVTNRVSHSMKLLRIATVSSLRGERLLRTMFFDPFRV